MPNWEKQKKGLILSPQKLYLNMDMIEISKLSKTFTTGREKIHALRGVNLRLAKGRSLALIGPTAAGKSVLLKCLIGLYPPQSGTIHIDSQAAHMVAAKRPPALNARIGMLFQQNALFNSLTVWENIAFRLIANHMPRKQARLRSEELLLRVGLSVTSATLFPSDLSGGMQKRVGFARAIASEPHILLLDNPTAGLDPILVARIDRMIVRLTREMGVTVISVTSNMKGIFEAYDEIAVLADGDLKWHGTTEAARTDKNEWLRQLLEARRDGPIKMQTDNMQAA